MNRTRFASTPPPPEFPKGVRLALPGDETPLFRLFLQAFNENGWGDCDPQIVRDVIALACQRERHPTGVAVEPDGTIAGVLALHQTRNWYSGPGGWYLTELLFYVAPAYRRSRHAAHLLQFAQWLEQESGIPVLLWIMAREGQAAKERLLARYGRRVSAGFMIGTGEFRYMRQKLAA